MPESPDAFRVMEALFKTGIDGVQAGLAVALLAACAVNLLLLSSWL